VGDRLSSERKLSELLQVGRSSVREAMKTLEAMGFVNRTTLGTTVCDQQTMDERFRLDARHTEIHEVIETGRIVGIQLAGLAAERANDQDVKDIEKTLEGIDLAEDIEIYWSRDMAFHKANVEAGHNTVFSHVYHIISFLLFKTHNYHSVLHRYDVLTDEEVRRNRRTTLVEHEKIVEAIKNHNAKAAKRAMADYLNRVEESLLTKTAKWSSSDGRIHFVFME
jgi:GntR family transcriptional regulator, transcriptional repressor for pyruvate dehydrogenase complex